MAARKLTLKEENFCLEFIKCGNASEAYRRAYSTGKMKPATINRKATAMMGKGTIRARIKNLRAPALKEMDVTQKRLTRELARIAFADLRAVLSWDANGVRLKKSEEIDADAAAILAGISETRDGLKIRTHDKIKAIELLLRMLGLLKGEQPNDEGKNDIIAEILGALHAPVK